MKKVKLGLLALTVGLLLASCSNNNETVDTEVVTKQVSDRIIAAVQAVELNADYVRYEDFYFPDGTKEERLLIEEDIFMTEEQLFQMEEAAKADPNSRQYRTNNLVTPSNRVITIIGYTGNDQFGLSNKGRTGLQWAINNYNRLSGVSISFQLTFGTNWQNKDMVVYDNSSNNSGSGGQAGFPTNGGDPFQFIQIYNLDGFTNNVNEHVITHEIGHAVGFRHTDFFSRQSCGQNVNEGSAGVGAIHISGTPTGYDSTSIMLACFSAGTNGEFNGNDITALRNMY